MSYRISLGISWLDGEVPLTNFNNSKGHGRTQGMFPELPFSNQNILTSTCNLIIKTMETEVVMFLLEKTKAKTKRNKAKSNKKKFALLHISSCNALWCVVSIAQSGNHTTPSQKSWILPYRHVKHIILLRIFFFLIRLFQIAKRQ